MSNNRELSQLASLITIDDADRSIGITTSVGIGTTNPGAKLDVNGTLNVTGVSTFRSSIDIYDGDILLKTSTDETVFSISYSSVSDDVSFTFDQTGGTGGSEVIYFLKDNATFKIRNTNTAGTIAKFTANGNNELYYDDNLKLETTNTGVNITGIATASRFSSTVSTGTAPISVASSTIVTNLNADFLDGKDGSYYLDYNNIIDGPTVGDGTLTLAVSGTGLSGSASFTANQSGNSTFTVTSNATSNNTNSTIVARNGSGGFSAGIITASNFRASASDTESAPGYSWDSDSNTGMFRPSADQIAWATGGNEGVRLTSTGIGIGITNPGSGLQVSGTDTTAGIRLTDNTAIFGDLSASGWLLYQRPTNALYSARGLTFRLDETNYATFNSSGYFGIGTEDPTSKLHVYADGNTTTGVPLAKIEATDTSVGASNILLDLSFSGDTNGTNGYFVRVQDSDTVIGGIQLNSATTVAYTGTSDYRLKTNVQPLTGAVDRVLSLKPCTFDWINGNSSEGFIAHELEEVVPLAVTGTKDEVDEDGNMVPQGVDPRHIVPILTSALQEALKRIEELEIKVAEIESLM